MTFSIFQLPENIPLKDFDKESTPDPLSKVPASDILQQILDIVKPNETVTKVQCFVLWISLNSWIYNSYFLLYHLY